MFQIHTEERNKIKKMSLRMLFCAALISCHLHYLNGMSVVTDNTEISEDCLAIDMDDILFLKSGDLFIYSENVTISNYVIKDNTFYICTNSSMDSMDAFEDCKKFSYDKDEYEMLPNKSVLLYGDLLLPGSYELKDDKILACETGSNYTDEEYDDVTYNVNSQASILVGKIGSGISILALLAHLVTFCLVPSLRNLPGYNVAALSLAFILGYSFLLIGQIPEVLGTFCIVSGMIQQYFFLVAFFCMNVMAFDVWRTLKEATSRMRSRFKKMKYFVYYSLYAWGVPLLLTIVCAIVDTVDGIPEKIKPHFGRDDICWMTNNFAKAIFFSIPAFSLFVMNAIFFVCSSYIIRNNRMEITNDLQRRTAKQNHILYIRLALMMGVTWLMGVVAALWESPIVWLINDLLNSLQGLFLFLLFTCSRKVMRHFKEVTSSKNSSSDRPTSISTKTDSP